MPVANMPPTLAPKKVWQKNVTIENFRLSGQENGKEESQLNDGEKAGKGATC